MTQIMSDQIKEILPHLKVGGSYLFEHIRKGPFIGIYQGVKPTKPGDPQDEIFFEVDAYTEDGSGQERLSNAFVRDELGRKMRPVYTKKLIRPSLLRTVTYPSSTTQKQMAEVFAETRKKGEEMARALGQTEAILPTISLPTAKAFEKLKEGPTAPVSNLKRNLLIGAGATAIPIVLYLVGRLI